MHLDPHLLCCWPQSCNCKSCIDLPLTTHSGPQKVRAELAPWEKKIAEVASRQSTATAERDLVLKQQADAEERLQVICFLKYEYKEYLNLFPE